MRRRHRPAITFTYSAEAQGRSDASFPFALLFFLLFFSCILLPILLFWLLLCAEWLLGHNHHCYLLLILAVIVVVQNGFWADHWTYHLDLVENYLTVFPEKEEYMLYDEEPIPFFSSPAQVSG
jgi:hypothetical protein